MGDFCSVAYFTLCLLICKFVTFAVRLKEASAEIWVYFEHLISNIYIYIYIYIYIKLSNIIFCRDSQRKCERAK